MDITTSDAYLGDSSLEEYVRGVCTFPVYDRDQETSLFAAARAGDETAFDAVVVAHLRFVVDLALERRGWGTSLKRLIEAGNRGLVRAARRFDPDDDRAFLDYAVWWIRQEMMEVLDFA